MLIGFLFTLVVTCSSTFSEPYNEVFTNGEQTKYQSENNFQNGLTSNRNGYRNQKRDIIKGPSLFSKIDASTADSDLAFENEDITGHSDLSRFYDKPNNIEDKLDDMDRWIAPNTHHLSGQLHVHKKKSYVDQRGASHFHDESASKKSMFPQHKHIRYEDVPDEVIKALYNWQLEDASNNNAKKSMLGNSSIDINPETVKPFVTEDGLSIEGRKTNRKKRRKINLLVNVKINETPARRSGVDLPHHPVSPWITLSSETEMPHKRHFPYFYPRHPRHRIHHGLLMKKILSEDSGSAEGSGSGMSDHHVSEEKTISEKMMLESEGENDESESSGSGHIPENMQHIPVSNSAPVVPPTSSLSTKSSVDVLTKNDSLPVTNANNTSSASKETDRISKEGDAGKVDNRAKEDSSLTNDNPLKEDVTTKDEGTQKVETTTQKELPTIKEEDKSQKYNNRETTLEPNDEKANDQEGSADQVDEKITEKNTGGQQVRKTTNDFIDKVSVGVAGPQSVSAAESGESGVREEPTDGSENMRKKNGQEDKYETLEEVREKFKKWESKIIHHPSKSVMDESGGADTKDEDQHEEMSPKKTIENSEENNVINKVVENNKNYDASQESEPHGETVADKPTEKTGESERPSEKLEEKMESSKLTSTSEAKPSTKAEENNNLPLKQQQDSMPATNVQTSTSTDKVVNTTIEKSDEGTSKRDENDTMSIKADDTSNMAKVKMNEEASSSGIKPLDLASGILITEKDGEEKGGEEETQHVMKQKEPDDFVKELIGIPSKKLILKEKDDIKSISKTTGNRAEKKLQGGGKSASKVEKSKDTEEAQDKFDIEEVNNKNKEHHDIPDSDMKDGAHTLIASDVASFENQVTSSDEGPSPEKTSSSLEVQSGSSDDKSLVSDEKSTSQASATEDKAHLGTEQPTKQTLMADTKTIKHIPEAESVAKQVQEASKKQSSEKETTSKHNPAVATIKKKISGAGDESEENESLHDKAALANPLITKEANEFSNEQEKSFASAIEKIKAQEEKLKGKEIDNEIQETLSPSKKHSGSTSKKGENNMKQLKIYRHQILSEVKKIDDLISEYHKDGHSTKELSEAKVVLQQDLNLVKELEKNTKKKSIKKEKEKESERLQIMPSSAYLSSSNDEIKEMTHRGKSALDSKTTTKSLEREAERSEKQLEEYYFHANSKSSVKHMKKPSLEEIHKLLKAEIKSLRQKKNGKADSQLKNIRKLVQQHLKKLISTGDIDKTAFHSLAPEIRQLGDLLKERIKSLKKKKTHNGKSKNIKPSSLTQKLKSGNKKASELFDQSMEAQVSTNELKGGTVKTDKIKTHHPAVEPKIGILEPSLENVKGMAGQNPDILAMSGSPSEHQSPSSASSSAPTLNEGRGEHGGKHSPVNDTVMLSALSNKEKPAATSGSTSNMNIQNLLSTLNEKLGVVYNNAKNVNEAAHKVAQPKPNITPLPEHASSQPEQAAAAKPHHSAGVYEQPIPGLSAGATQRYVSQRPQTGGKTVAANVPTTPTNQPMQLELTVHPDEATPHLIPAAAIPPQESVQQTNQPAPQEVTPPQVVDATEVPMVSTNSQPPIESGSESASVAPATPSATVPEQETQSNETPTPEVEPHQETPADNKENLPMVPEEPEFEEDNTEALASLEPINTLVETLEKDITEIWSYKDLYPNAEALGLDNEKVHNTYANLGSLSGLSLRRALNRALRGEDVGLGIVGGSISKGGPFSEKGLEYVLRSYFYAIEDYWNKVIRPVTGSSMIVRDVSLGGISTDYYSFCIRNHLPDDKLTNIVLWELSANDMRRYDDSLKPKPQPLEQFTRNILTYRAKPSLIFVNFFALFDWDPDLRANCRNFEDEGEDDVAKYYKITSLSWRNMVCPLLKSETSPIFTRNNLFAEDHFHPSILGHAQMSYIIIDYIRTEFLKNLVKMRPFFIGDAVEKLQIPRSIYMPRPMFKETFLWKPLCYTYMLVDNRLPNNTMPLHEENESDFKYTVVRGFKIRSDKIAGMETKLKDQFIRYRLQIPRHEDGGIQPFKQLGIMSFTDDRYAEIQFDSQHPSRLEAKKRFLEGTVIKTIAENIEPGEHTLTVRSGDIGFLVCALVLG